MRKYKSFVDEELEREKLGSADPEIREDHFERFKALFSFVRKPKKQLRAWKPTVKTDESVIKLVDIYSSVMERNIKLKSEELQGEEALRYLERRKALQRYGLEVGND